jgi:two-component sensor histidine kinase
MAPPTTDIAATLALAVVTATDTPLLLLDRDLHILAASAAFLLAFDLDPMAVTGRSIFDLGKGEWNLPRLRSLLTAAASSNAEIPAYELTLERPGRPALSLLLSASRLTHAQDMDERLLLTISDVTQRRATEALKDKLIGEKDVLLREMQHRVANSLQIIASVLLQNARKVQSEESRGHLRDAHQRVMSVAAVQRQLAESNLSKVTIRPYLAQLCQSLGASMIGDHEQLRLVVTGDESDTTPEISVSLGLIVTELVINALKHAFPDDRKGLITVDYRASPEGWTLSVVDDGIGMRGLGQTAKPGLGTSIVQALSAQLAARITIADLKPGTGVSIIHIDADKLSGATPLLEVVAV